LKALECDSSSEDFCYLQTEPITIYHIGEEWWDLCAGPHVDTTGELPANAIKLESLVRARCDVRRILSLGDGGSHEACSLSALLRPFVVSCLRVEGHLVCSQLSVAILLFSPVVMKGGRVSLLATMFELVLHMTMRAWERRASMTCIRWRGSGGCLLEGGREAADADPRVRYRLGEQGPAQGKQHHMTACWCMRETALKYIKFFAVYVEVELSSPAGMNWSDVDVWTCVAARPHNPTTRDPRIRGSLLRLVTDHCVC
jgi:hypothetical protein